MSAILPLSPADRALATAFTPTFELNKAIVEFVIDDCDRYSLEQMLETNNDDPDICAWLRSAKPGDTLNDMCRIECVHEGELTDAQEEKRLQDCVRTCGVCFGSGWNCPECSGWE